MPLALAFSRSRSILPYARVANSPVDMSVLMVCVVQHFRLNEQAAESFVVAAEEKPFPIGAQLAFLVLIEGNNLYFSRILGCKVEEYRLCHRLFGKREFGILCRGASLPHPMSSLPERAEKTRRFLIRENVRYRHERTQT